MLVICYSWSEVKEIAEEKRSGGPKWEKAFRRKESEARSLVHPPDGGGFIPRQGWR